MVKNANVRAEMARYGVTQTQLACMLGTKQSDVSRILSVELDENEQTRIIGIIKEQYKGE